MELSNDLLKYTPREVQIARLIAQGLSTKMIADELGTSPRTVKAQRHRLIKKAECGNSIEAILKMKREGVI